MLFLDVTSSCKSAKNTGMQRMTRALYLHLRNRLPVTPICWNKKGRCYQHLGRRELKLLLTPFRILSGATAKPEWRGETFLAELHRLAFRKTVRLENQITSGDILLIPDFYSDVRTQRLPELITGTGIQSVAIFHDAAALRLPQLSVKARIRFQNYLKSLAAFAQVICISHESHNDLLQRWREYGTSPAATRVEPWPIEFDRAVRAADSVSARNMIACVGSFEPRKNHLTLLAAAEKLWLQGHDFELQLVGRTTGYYAPKMLPAVWRLQRRGRPLRWLRHVNDETLHEVYRSCRFTVYPSLFEGFGLPIAESLWHGKPCICGGNGALGEVARGGGCLIVDQTSEDALASGIKKLLSDQEAYIRLCTEARARKFRSWPDYIEKLLGHLQSPSKSVSIPAICGT
jgi:glycosyltransferase involved in cell wall biosynthesis